VTISADRTIRFPHRRSIGTLYAAPEDQPEEWQLLTQVRGLIVSPENQPIKWEWLEEARGNVTIPSACKIKLKILGKGASLSALDDLEPDVLHALDLGHSDCSNGSLSHLPRHTGLRVLELNSTNVGDDGLAHLRSLTNLQSLGLSHSRVTTNGLAQITHLKNLREVWLSGTEVDDVGLGYFVDLFLLVQLGLSGTRVTDSGLETLTNLKNLLRVYLFNTKVSHNGTQALRAALPGCRVKWHPAKIHTQDAEQKHFIDNSSKAENDTSHALPKGCGKFASVMDENLFWSIIDCLDWSSVGNDAAVIQPAAAKLAELAVEDICAFSEILAEKLYLLDGVAYAREIGTDSFNGSKGNFAQNWFLYVRCCAVANGKQAFAQILANPSEMPKDMEFQALLSIAPKAYKMKTGHRFNYQTSFNYETFANQEAWVDG
jgi:hypothetical protein